MKKKILIVLGAIIFIGVISFILWSNRTVSTITIDINPSIQINLKKDGSVKRVIALNNDAKNVISNDLKGKTLYETIKSITNKVIENGYTEENYVAILVYTKDKELSGNIVQKLADSFGEQHFNAEIIAIENIRKEDRELAKKYNITPAKASYINALSKENENIKAKDLINKPVEELKETKETGNYCDSGYTLEGSFCLKEKERITASDGEVCPNGYYDYEGTCYEEGGSEDTDELECSPDFTLDGTKCNLEQIIDAETVKYSCSQGEAKTRAEAGLSSANDGDAKEIVCIDYSNATHPVTPCELPADDPTERMSSGGRCYWHRAPVIAEGCPGKIQVAGECWDDATNIYICAGYRDGKQYSSKNEYCEHSIKYLTPTVTEYKCPGGYTLDGSKCHKTEVQDAWYKKVCQSGYTETNNGRCINKNKTTKKVNGLVCDMPYSKLKGNECIIYEIVDAKHN